MNILKFKSICSISIIGMIAFSLILLPGLVHAKTYAVKDGKAILLKDDFQGQLSTNWTIGTNSDQNDNGPKSAISDGQFLFTQMYDFIETKKSFSDDFIIEFDVMRKSGSFQCADFYIELVSIGAPAAIMRFRYGSDAKESINLGEPPHLSGTSREWDCIRDPGYLRELVHQGACKGRIKLEHKENKVTFSHTDDDGRNIATPWVSVKSFGETKVRIWGLGGKGSPRYIDNLEIYKEVEEGMENTVATTATADSESDILFTDDFSGSLSDHWTTGTNSQKNKKGTTVKIVDKQVAFSQLYDYIETKDSFDGNFEIAFDVYRKMGSNQCADFFVELVSVGDPAGVMRFRYGSDAKESINIGRPPKMTGTGREWDCIRQGGYLKEITHNGECKGRITFRYNDGKVQMSFTNDEGQTMTTSWVSASAVKSTKVRIWGLGGGGTTTARYLDNVVVTRLK